MGQDQVSGGVSVLCSMNIINCSRILQTFGENVNFGNFQTNCRVNTKNCIFVSTYSYIISVVFHTFFFTFGKVTESQNFKKRQNIRYRATATLRRPHIKQYISQKRGEGNKTTRNIIKFGQSMKRCTRRP